MIVGTDSSALKEICLRVQTYAVRPLVVVVKRLVGSETVDEVVSTVLNVDLLFVITASTKGIV